MDQFKIKKDSFKEIRNKMLIKSIPSSLIAIIGGLAISYFNPNIQQSDVNILPIFLLFVLALFTFEIYKSVKRQKEIFESYMLIINNNEISREQHNTPTITISKADINEIIKNSNGSFTIKGNSVVNMIGIPSQIEDYEKLENLLSEIKIISVKTSEPILQKLSGILSIVTIGLMATVYICKNKILVGFSGIILLAILAYSFYEIKRSKNIDSRIKNGMWWIIVVIASIIGVLYFKLTGHQ